MPLPPAGSDETWGDDYGDSASLAADGAVKAAELRNVLSLSSLRQFAGHLVGAIGTIFSLSEAYSRCRP